MLKPRLKSSGSQTPAWSLLKYCPTIVVIAITLYLLSSLEYFLCPDVAGQFVIARMMRHGARLYTDIFEINPPLWFWIAIPFDWLTEVLKVPVAAMVIMAMSVFVLAIMGLVNRLLGEQDRLFRVFFVSYAAIILLLMPLRMFEQREHIVLITSIPYLLLAAARRSSQRVSIRLAMTVGITAAIGFALKPYFLGVPVLIEIWLITCLRNRWRPLRPETLSLAAVGVGYAAAVLVFAPQYLTDAVPILRYAYLGYGEPIWKLFGIMQLIWLFALVGIATQVRVIRTGMTPVTTALLIGAAGFAIAWLMQGKGWFYQALPTTGCLILALAAVVMEMRGRIGPFLKIAGPAILLVPLSLLMLPNELPLDKRDDIAPAVQGLRPGDPYGIISSFGIVSWPSLVDMHLRGSSRYLAYWMLRALSTPPVLPAVAQFGERVIGETVLDYRCLPPKVIIFVIFDRGSSLPIRDPERYFMRSPDFARLMAHYQPFQSGHIYNAYRQISPLEPVDQTRCRRAVTS